MELQSINDAPEVGQFSLSQLTKVTTVSKYLALTLFLTLPFLGGWVGYTMHRSQSVEVPAVVVTATSTPAATVANSVVLRVLGEVAGGISYIPFDDTSKEHLALFEAAKKDFYTTDVRKETPEAFLIRIDDMVRKGKFTEVAHVVPIQGMIQRFGYPNQKEPFKYHNLLTAAVLTDFVSSSELNDTFKAGINYGYALQQSNPLRSGLVMFDTSAAYDGTDESLASQSILEYLNSHTDKKATDLVTCKPIDLQSAAATTTALAHDIVAGTFEFGGMSVGDVAREHTIAKTIYSCRTEWGGTGVVAYIQPAIDSDSYELLMTQYYYWE
jgi:hypothetical protein